MTIFRTASPTSESSFLTRAPTLAPWDNSASAASALPNSAAQCNGVQPFSSPALTRGSPSRRDKIAEALFSIAHSWTCPRFPSMTDEVDRPAFPVSVSHPVADKANNPRAKMAVAILGLLIGWFLRGG